MKMKNSTGRKLRYGSTSVAIVALVLAIVGTVFGFLFGAKRTKNNFEREKGTLEEQKRKIIEQAEEQSRAMKKEALLEAKEQDIKLRNEFERESKEKRRPLPFSLTNSLFCGIIVDVYRSM